MTDKTDTAKKLLTQLMKDKITVKCTTCNITFLDMKWNQYLWLLNGDYNTPTKWYNQVALHYCQHPNRLKELNEQVKLWPHSKTSPLDEALDHWLGEYYAPSPKQQSTLRGKNIEHP